MWNWNSELSASMSSLLRLRHYVMSPALVTLQSVRDLALSSRLFYPASFYSLIEWWWRWCFISVSHKKDERGVNESENIKILRVFSTDSIYLTRGAFASWWRRFSAYFRGCANSSASFFMLERASLETEWKWNHGCSRTRSKILCVAMVAFVVISQSCHLPGQDSSCFPRVNKDEMRDIFECLGRWLASVD